MQAVLFIIARVAQLMLGFLEIALLLRMILTWFITNEQNRLLLFLYAVTEPFILPFRVLCHAFGLPEDFPIDIPYSIAFTALILANGLLPALTY